MSREKFARAVARASERAASSASISRGGRRAAGDRPSSAMVLAVAGRVVRVRMTPAGAALLEGYADALRTLTRSMPDTATIVEHVRAVGFLLERLATAPDGSTIDLDYIEPPAPAPALPSGRK